MRVVVGVADTGSLKQFVFATDTDTSNPQSPKPSVEAFQAVKGDPVTHLAAVAEGLVVVRKKGAIDLLKYTEYIPLRSLGVQENLIGLAAVDSKLIWLAQNGSGKILDLVTNDTKDFSIECKSALNTFKSSRNDRGIFLVAGENELPRIVRVDLETASVEPVWMAKNPKNTKVDLPERNLVTDGCFVSTKQYSVATVTSHGKIRIYDTSVGGRPVATTDMSKYPLKAVVASDDKIIVGDSQAKLSLWQTDPLRLLGNYKGVVGATTSISLRGSYVASGGLDRYLRAYEVDTRKPAGKIYVGEEISALCILQDEDETRRAEEDGIWHDIDALGPGKKRQKRSHGSDSNSDKKSSPHSSDESSATEITDEEIITDSSSESDESVEYTSDSSSA